MAGGGERFRGCGTALITPFRADGAVDERALERLVAWQIAEGIDFLVPGGTTGEAATLTREEHLRVVRTVVMASRAAARPVPVLGGAGGNNTAAVVALARDVEALGVDGILSVAPAYNKPTQEGLYQHFAAIAAAVRVPVVLYNVPGRTASNIEPATVARLAALDAIAGVKEASGSLAQMAGVLAATAGAANAFTVLCGDDPWALPAIALGAEGLISVAANEIPGPMTALVRAARSGDGKQARTLHFRYLPLMEANFVESNPIPVKAAMAALGFCEEIYRLPLVALGEASRRKLMAAMESVALTPRR